MSVQTDSTADETVYSEWADQLQGRDSLAGTPFSKLFHVARTTTPARAQNGVFNAVTVSVRVDDGELTVSSPTKTRQGEHLRGSDYYDGMITLSIRPFMEAHVARDEIIRQLKDTHRYQTPYRNR